MGDRIVNITVKRAIFFLAIVSLIIWVAIGIIPYLRTYPAKHPNIFEVSGRVSLDFPVSSKLIGSEYYNWKGETLKAKVSMDRSDFQVFLKSLSYAQRVDSQLVYKMDGGNPKWWDPDSVSHPLLMYIERTHKEFGRNELWVLVAPEKNQQVIIYLFMEKEHG